MRNVLAVFKKQLKDTLKNKTVLIQFLMFPILTVIMNNAVKMEGMPENFFVNLFAVMYIGMAPLTSMAAIVSEEKEKDTLRVLLMSKVSPCEYLLGVGSYVFFICMAGGAAFCIEGKYRGREAVIFLAVMAAGILCSLFVGAAIGTWSRNQMMATSVTVPVMMVFSFLPMLSMFNTAVAKAAKFLYSEQVSRMMNQLHDFHPDGAGMVIIAVNMLIAAGLFAAAFRKCGLT